jgi:hypothetical protein
MFFFIPLSCKTLCQHHVRVSFLIFQFLLSFATSTRYCLYNWPTILFSVSSRAFCVSRALFKVVFESMTARIFWNMETKGDSFPTSLIFLFPSYWLSGSFPALRCISVHGVHTYLYVLQLSAPEWSKKNIYSREKEKNKKKYSFLIKTQKRSEYSPFSLVKPWLICPDSSAVLATCFTSAWNRILIWYDSPLAGAFMYFHHFFE